ncbi:MAG: DNA polymerase III subunit alpha [Candidatus Pacebacteria bacterium]|nr:DNA polymerase III subunit alpha [Candidatus Paceibacterota bacterium]
MHKFSHLHTHSHYSLLNALPKIKALVSLAKEYKMPALALTDSGNMYGTIEFYNECLKQEIKPIIGVDFYVALKTRHDKRSGIDNRNNRLILLAKNEKGYKNLIRLVTDSHIQGFYYKARVDKELLEKYKEGLICIMPHFSGEISKALVVNDFEKAKEIADWYKSIFPNFFLEITHHPELEGQLDLKKKIIDFAKKENIELIAGQDVYYLKPEDKTARDILMSIQASGRSPYKDQKDNFSFIDQKTANEYFKDTPSALENIQKIIDLCNLELEIDSWIFPDIDIPEGEDYNTRLRKLTYKGIAKRGLEDTEKLRERIEYELEIIKNKGYSSYFLIVADLLKYARKAEIYTNTRGSAAGSIVSYLNFITRINPIELKIPFERFMNPQRPGIPDIDVDIADIKRDDVINYLRAKYGKKAVAQIGTFGTMAARGSVRDVTRALGLPYELGDKIAKLIPMGSQGFPMTIERALEMEEDLRKLHKNDKDVQEIIKYAKQIEGCARHISTHAAGVLISPTRVDDYTPVQLDKDGQIITQYDMYTGGRDGVVNLPKFDILGIKNLSILSNTVKLVKKLRGIEVDLDNVDLEDKKTYEMLARGETLGTFQLSGQGMTQYLKALKPKSIWDIMAMVALYRPGPMAFIPDYIKRKENPRLIKYLVPELKDILEPTYGIIIYQDDVMLIAVNLAGYTWAEADKFRKAMGKKIPEMMQEQKEKFFKGCLEHGIEEKKVQELWETIETFAAYGFNKAHSASYGRVAYETSYMKANYPIEYMTALLMADSGDAEKVAEIISECKKIGVPVLPPDINESFADFTIIKDEDNNECIRFGLQTIKNFGEGIANAIITERKNNGKFKSLIDFIERINNRNLNKKSLEALTMCGAMDSLEERGQIMGNMPELLNYNKENAQKSKDQISLFGDDDTVSKITLEKTEPASMEEKLAWEKELLGLYISGHPLDKYKTQLEKAKTSIKQIKAELNENTTTVVAGIIEESKEILTKKGEKMAFVRLSDFSDTLEVVVFPKIFKEFNEFLETEKCVLIKGRLSKRQGETSLLVEKIKELK